MEIYCPKMCDRSRICDTSKIKTCKQDSVRLSWHVNTIIEVVCASSIPKTNTSKRNMQILVLQIVMG